MSEPTPISIRPPRWLLKPAVDGAAELGADLSLSPLMAQLLVQRGLTSVEMARDFLVPKLATLGDPTVLPDEGVPHMRAHKINGLRLKRRCRFTVWTLLVVLVVPNDRRCIERQIQRSRMSGV